MPSPNPERALGLFREGRDLDAQGDYAGACAKFEASYGLEPRLGTLLNLGDCNERLGRTATALRHFVDAATTARRAGDEERERYATQRGSSLQGRAPTVVLRGLTHSAERAVSVDGIVVPAAEGEVVVRLDPGRHEVLVHLRDNGMWTNTFDLADGAPPTVLTVPPAAPKDAPRAVAVERGLPAGRVVALGTAAVGVTGVATGTVFGLLARSRWNDAVANHCPALPVCDPTGVREAGDAKQAALASTVAFGVGLAALGTAAVLWWTSPRTDRPSGAPATFVTPVPIAGGASLTVQGGF